MSVLLRAKNRMVILPPCYSIFSISNKYAIRNYNENNLLGSISTNLSYSSSFSTLPSPSSLSSNDDNNKKQTQSPNSSPTTTLLYKSSSPTIPRGLLSFSSLNCIYWFWYISDFMPTVLNSELHIFPELGYTGFIFSIGMVIGSCLYPKYLINEITMTKDKYVTYNIKRHTLPFCTMEDKGIKSNYIQLVYNRDIVTNDMNEHLFLKVIPDSVGKDKKYIMHIRPNEIHQLDIWQTIIDGENININTRNNEKTAIYKKKDKDEIGRNKRKLLKENRLRKRNN